MRSRCLRMMAVFIGTVVFVTVVFAAGNVSARGVKKCCANLQDTTCSFDQVPWTHCDGDSDCKNEGFTNCCDADLDECPAKIE